MQQRHLPCYVGHIRAHSVLPGTLAEGNNTADKLTQLIGLTQVEAAQEAHAKHHLNSQTLRLQFKIAREAARQIVKQCASCPPLQNVPHPGINTRGFKPGQIWQMDVTHVPEFRRLKYVRVSIDTFSG